MTPSDIDEYLAALDEPKRATLVELRRMIHTIVPGVEECIAYGVPGFRLDGELIAGFAAFQRHLSYFPHSGSVLARLAGDVAEYDTAKGTLRFAIDDVLPADLVRRLIETRRAELE